MSPYLATLVYVPFHCYQVTQKQDEQVTRTYHLIEAKISMEATT